MINELKNKKWASIIVCAILFFVIFILVFFGAAKIANESLRIFLTTLLSTIDTVVLANVLWELIAKKNFADSLLELVKISDNIHGSGIETFYVDFQDINWETELKHTKNLTAVFTYAATWRNSNRRELEKFVKTKGRKKKRFTVILPDPNQDDCMAEFDRRFKYSEGKTKEKIEEAILAFSDLGAEVYLYPGTIQASYYQLDRICIMSFFNHLDRKGIVPAIKAECGGGLYRFIQEDITAIKSKSDKVTHCESILQQGKETTRITRAQNE